MPNPGTKNPSPACAATTKSIMSFFKRKAPKKRQRGRPKKSPLECASILDNSSNISEYEDRFTKKRTKLSFSGRRLTKKKRFEIEG